MKSKMETCSLITRRLTPGRGIAETSQPVGSLEELFAQCVAKTAPDLVERLLLAGRDAKGRPRFITFTFQSVSDQDY